MSTIIELHEASKSFFTLDMETRALSDVSLRVCRGEFVSIMGPSGCGKSTLLSILGLLDQPTTGEYMLNGKAVAKVGRAERAAARNREIGFIFQSFNLLSGLTVAENVELPLTFRSMRSGERQRAVAEALEKVDLSSRAKHFPSQLSGGQQQRVAIARAVAGNPSVLLADEPTGNLDSKNSAAVLELLKTLHLRGSTIIMVTHDQGQARQAGRIVQMRDGSIDDKS